jgi:hypothetical protein
MKSYNRPQDRPKDPCDVCGHDKRVIIDNFRIDCLTENHLHILQADLFISYICVVCLSEKLAGIAANDTKTAEV